MHDCSRLVNFTNSLSQFNLTGLIYFYLNFFHSCSNLFCSFQNLNWACVSLVISPNLADKTTHSMLSFVLENLIKPLGSSCIPLEVYRRSVYSSHFSLHVRESKIVLDSMLWILDS